MPATAYAEIDRAIHRDGLCLYSLLDWVAV